MHLINILFVGIALSFDTMAVGAANAARHHDMPLLKAIRISFFFGFFSIVHAASWLADRFWFSGVYYQI